MNAQAPDVDVRLASERLQVSAPGLHFLSGKPLEQLRHGNTIAFDIQVSILTDARQTVLHRSFERFVLSYDVWEEKFSVARLRSTGGNASHLTSTAAEAWCVQRFSLLTAGLPQDRPLWVRIDVRASEARSTRNSDANPEEDRLSIANLIDLFSRPPAKTKAPSQWRVESGQFQLAQLRNGVRPTR